jgi:hypothetical protein
MKKLMLERYLVEEFALSCNSCMEIVTDLRLVYVRGRRKVPISKRIEVKGVGLMGKVLLPKDLSALCNLRRVKMGRGTQ